MPTMATNPQPVKTFNSSQDPFPLKGSSENNYFHSYTNTYLIFISYNY